MRRFGSGTAVLLVLASAVFGRDLGSRVREAMAASPAARQAFWGVQVVDLESGQILVDENADHLFVPASNTKLFTTALALTRLGADYRFETTVVAERAPDEAGKVGSLRLVGGGDPNLSARAIPYHMGPAAGDPLQAVEDLARQLMERGVRRVEGDIIGDDTAYVWAPYPEGWAADDAIWDYGAPVSALTINDNAFSLTVRPGEREGEPAHVTLQPPVEYYEIDNRVRTAAGVERKIQIDREAGSRQLRVWGTIPLRDAGETQLLAIDDPALYAARALLNALVRRGVSVTGRTAVRHLYPNEVADLQRGPAPPQTDGVVLARRTSAPLVEDLRITDKVSQNLHAELALRAVGRASRRIGSREAGLEEMKAFLHTIGVEGNAYSLHDGSGLTRLNLVTPSAVVKLLRAMYGSPQREAWMSLLPVGGQDGTLSARFGDLAAAGGSIHAKTGTLTHVSALSGYAERKDGRVLAFSILANNYQGASSEIRGVIDRICILMLE
ncbi:MAG TPA: D-alanyl-D-alanine carboxypeptidase/D-alanyl-D-alanine-endopeptidase [Bryobacteraceae bacterium]|nr:D-alanyl-D-alanine carboxypeptidase/D-alanyl-D-alanine-endopeptidase [Bryobacteraceae bacterium]